MPPAEYKTSRFISEFNTAKLVQSTAESRGVKLTLEQAHSVWAEHSDDYCAQWLAVDSENPKAELWRAISKWEARHRTRSRRRITKADAEKIVETVRQLHTPDPS